MTKVKLPVLTQYAFIVPVYDFEGPTDFHPIDEHDASVAYQVFHYDLEERSYQTYGHYFDTAKEARECALVMAASVLIEMNGKYNMQWSEKSKKLMEEYDNLPDEVKYEKY